MRASLFSAEENVGIKPMKKVALWLLMHWPDTMGWWGWKRTARKLVTVFIILYLASTLLFNFSIYGMVVRIAAMTGFAGLLYAKNIGFIAYGFLERWENLA